MSTEPSADAQSLRERIKIAIQTAQDSEGRLLYVIPPGAAGLYADAVMRVLTGLPYPYQDAAHDAEVAARAWEEGLIAEANKWMKEPVNPYRAEAARHREGETT